MRRREFITLLGSAAAWSITARAQQSAVPVIGFLHFGTPTPFADQIAAFHQGLKETLSRHRPTGAVLSGSAGARKESAALFRPRKRRVFQQNRPNADIANGVLVRA